MKGYNNNVDKSADDLQMDWYNVFTWKCFCVGAEENIRIGRKKKKPYTSSQIIGKQKSMKCQTQ